MSAPEDRERFDQFVAARLPALQRTAYLLTGNQADAEDLVQVALVRCVPCWSRIADNPEPYVRKVLVNENISRWRRRRWREVQVDSPPEPATVDSTSDDRLVLARALSALAPRQRAVIVLRYYEDLTERDTATLLGISVGSVKSQARDALARLRTLMPDLHDDAPPQPAGSTRR